MSADTPGDNGAGPGGISLAAVLYTPDTADRSVLVRFAGALEHRGWRVGGLTQEVVYDPEGTRVGVDAVELDTGRRIPIARPSRQDLEAGTCGLDWGALVESSAALRRGTANGVDVLVVEKFGEREQQGEGLADDILGAVAAGIPTLVAVPAEALESWRRFTGGLGDLLPFDIEALWRWWGPARLLDELVLGVDDGDVREVVLGRNWTLVTGPKGTGVASSPPPNAPGLRRIEGAGELSRRSQRELARLATSWNPIETAIGVAAINAHYNRFDLTGDEDNGLDLFAGLEGPVTVVGRFPALAEHLPGCRVVERDPRPGEYPEVAAPAVLARGEGAVLTASSLANRTLPNLLAACRGVPVALVGPGTPLNPNLHAYGIEALSGMVIVDPEGAARAVAQGGGEKALKAHGRYVTLRRGSVG